MRRASLRDLRRIVAVADDIRVTERIPDVAGTLPLLLSSSPTRSTSSPGVSSSSLTCRRESAASLSRKATSESADRVTPTAQPRTAIPSPAGPTEACLSDAASHFVVRAIAHTESYLQGWVGIYPSAKTQTRQYSSRWRKACFLATI
jgi:hypothetical protein